MARYDRINANQDIRNNFKGKAATHNFVVIEIGVISEKSYSYLQGITHMPLFEIDSPFCTK